MVDIPFGVSRLDSMLDGGVPTGSVVLLATEPGAGGRKFAQTSAAMNALATTDNEAVERHYRGIDHEGVIVPGSVHYLSVAATTDSLEAALTETDRAAAFRSRGDLRALRQLASGSDSPAVRERATAVVRAFDRLRLAVWGVRRAETPNA